MMIFYPILIGLILISNYEIVNSLTCKNKQGEPVDYWVAYVPPKGVNNGYFYISSKKDESLENPNVPKADFSNTNSGYFGNLVKSASDLAFSRSDSSATNLADSSSEKWQHSTDSIGSHESIVYQTFREFYDGNKEHNYAMFSDKKPQDTPSQTLASNVPLRKLFAKLKKFGAPKGVIAWDNSNGNGFWVMSSISSFGPFSKTKYQWGDETSHSSTSSKSSMLKLFSRKSSPSNRDNGHLTMCLSLHEDNTKKVLEHLITMNVQVYDKNIPKGEKYLEDVSKLANKFSMRNNEKGFADRITAGNEKFSIYRKKANSFGKVYDKSPNKSLNFKSSLSQPKSKIRSLFGKLKRKVTSTIHDISEIQISDQKWSAKDDESNWAVSRDGNVFCFSDLGHHAGFTDAGAMVCLNQPNLHDAFLKSAVKTIQN